MAKKRKLSAEAIRVENEIKSALRSQRLPVNKFTVGRLANRWWDSMLFSDTHWTATELARGLRAHWDDVACYVFKGKVSLPPLPKSRLENTKE